MRVENVKGAVWTVDEMEFYKRRPQRLQERLPSSSASVSGSTHDRSSMDMVLGAENGVTDRSVNLGVNGILDMEHHHHHRSREVSDLSVNLTRDIVSEMREAFPEDKDSIISHFASNNPAMNHNNGSRHFKVGLRDTPSYHVSNAMNNSRTPSRSSSRSPSPGSPVGHSVGHEVTSRSPSSSPPPSSPTTITGGTIHDHRQHQHHEEEDQEEDDDHKETAGIKPEA